MMGWDGMVQYIIIRTTQDTACYMYLIQSELVWPINFSATHPLSRGTCSLFKSKFL